MITKNEYLPRDVPQLQASSYDWSKFKSTLDKLDERYNKFELVWNHLLHKFEVKLKGEK